MRFASSIAKYIINTHDLWSSKENDKAYNSKWGKETRQINSLSPSQFACQASRHRL